MNWKLCNRVCVDRLYASIEQPVFLSITRCVFHTLSAVEIWNTLLYRDPLPLVFERSDRS